MDLTVLERLVLLGLMPAEGDLTTLRIVRELREALSFDEDEHVQYGLRQEDGRVVWTDDGSTAAIEIGARARRVIEDRLNELNNDGKLTEQHLSVCDKFGIGD